MQWSAHQALQELGYILERDAVVRQGSRTLGVGAHGFRMEEPKRHACVEAGTDAARGAQAVLIEQWEYEDGRQGGPKAVIPPPSAADLELAGA